jgi:hypothetical protein
VRLELKDGLPKGVYLVSVRSAGSLQADRLVVTD